MILVNLVEVLSSLGKTSDRLRKVFKLKFLSISSLAGEISRILLLYKSAVGKVPLSHYDCHPF